MIPFNPIDLLTKQYEIKHDPDCEYWVIGDVHGCLDEYNELVEKINQQATKQVKIIQLGDMIDRGPFFKSIIMYDLADYKLMGNHEWNFILEHYGMKVCRSKSRNINHEKLKTWDKNVQDDFMKVIKNRNLFYYMVIGEDFYIFSHSPCSNFLFNDMDRNPFSKMLSNTNISTFAMSEKYSYLVVDDNNYKNKVAIHGHTQWNYYSIHDQIKNQESDGYKIFNIDSGCVYGKKLTAIRVGDLKVVDVQSEFTHKETNQ